MRHGIYEPTDPVWRFSLKARKFLELPNSRYGVLFRGPTLTPPDKGKVLCAFCMSGEDSGLHLTRDCRKLPLHLATLREKLTASAGDWRTLRLSDDAWVASHPEWTADALRWMEEVYQSRTFKKAPSDRNLTHYIGEDPLLVNSRPQCLGCNGTFKSKGGLTQHLRRNKNCSAAISFQEAASRPNPAPTPSLLNICKTLSA